MTAMETLYNVCLEYHVGATEGLPLVRYTPGGADVGATEGLTLVRYRLACQSVGAMNGLTLVTHMILRACVVRGIVSHPR